MKKMGYLNRYVILTVAVYSPAAIATTGLAGLDKVFMELMTIVFVVAGIVAATISWWGNRSERTNDSHHTLSILLIVIAIVTWFSASKLDSFVKTSIVVAYPLSLLAGRSILRWKERRVKPGLVVTAGFVLLVALNPKVIDFTNYVILDNDPLENSVLVVGREPTLENIPPSEDFIELEGGTILYSPHFRNNLVGTSTGSSVMLVDNRSTEKIDLFYAKSIERIKTRKSLFHLPIFDKPIDGNTKSLLPNVSIVVRAGEIVWADLSEKLFDQIKNRKPNTTLITWLLQNGADPNYTPDPKYITNAPTPMNNFYVAIRSRDLDLVNLFLDYGADPNYGDNRNALTVLSGSAHYIDLFSTLLSRGADPNFRTKSNMETPLHYYADNSLNYEMVKLLLENGADRSLRNKNNQTAEDLVRDRIERIRRYQERIGLEEDAISEKVKHEQKVLNLLM
jgi:hypothetical protein